MANARARARATARVGPGAARRLRAERRSGTASPRRMCGRPSRRSSRRGRCGCRTPRGGPGAGPGGLRRVRRGSQLPGPCAAWEPAKVSSSDAHGRHDPHRDSRRGDRRSGIGPDAAPAHPPDRLREWRRPCRFRTPDHPSAVSHRILRGGAAAAQDLLPQFRRGRGQRQQTGKNRRAQPALRVIEAGLALLGVPDDQVARLLAQLPIPVGQQFPHHRAGLPPGQARCAAHRTISPADHGCVRPGRAPGSLARRARWQDRCHPGRA